MIEFDFWDLPHDSPHTFGLKLSFDAMSADELDQAAVMIQCARPLAENGTRMAHEIEAALAYCKTLAMCLRAPPLARVAGDSGEGSNG